MSQANYEYIDGVNFTILLKEKNWEFEWWRWNTILFRWDDKVKLVEEMRERCKECWWNLNLIFRERKKNKNDKDR